MKKTISWLSIAAVLVSAALSVAVPIAQAATPNWDITGTWNLDFTLGGGDYLHTMTVTLFNQTNGVFSGTGVYDADSSYTWDVTGTVSGDDITFHILYTGTNPGYTVDAIGTIVSDTLMSGTWNSGAGTWTGTGTAVLLSVITNPATGVTSNDATLNGTNGGSAATGHSFWVSLATFDTSSPTIPSGVYSTPDLGAIAANTAFSASLSSITTTGVPTNLPAVTPGTKYYFVAWSLVGGTWYPGAILNFTTQAAKPAVITNPATGVTLDDATLNGTNGPADATGHSFWVSLDTFSTASPTIPSGVYSTPDLGAIAANTAFSASLSSITTTGVPTNLPAVTPGTKYYFVAWSLVGGTWYPGEILNFTTTNTGTLIVTKDTVGGDSTFSLTGTGDLGTFIIVTASGAGNKEFNNLAPGNYTVTEPNVPSGWQQTDNDCNAIAVTAGGTFSCTVTNTKIGTPKLGEIRGAKLEDRDGDGKLNDGFNRRLSGWTIYLDINKNGVLNSGEPSTVTNRFGEYRFKSLPAGTYVVREVLQFGWTQTYPASGFYKVEVIAGKGKIAKKNNFGNFKLGVISGMKFNDLNGNGRKDSGDVGLSGWTINLKGPHGFASSTVTAADGSYSFTGLSAGTYTLSETAQIGWTQTAHPGSVKIQSGTVSTKDNFGNHLGPVNNDTNHDWNWNWNWNWNGHH